MLPAVLLKRRGEKVRSNAKRPKVVDDKESDDEESTAEKQEIPLDENGEDLRSRTCPYLDTINRNMLDFDFEKLCSVSLSHLNVYACLVCGKYYQ
ncbi:uncharacterized protein DEA37_0011519, partial [Paragonimus westermani]